MAKHLQRMSDKCSGGGIIRPHAAFSSLLSVQKDDCLLFCPFAYTDVLLINVLVGAGAVLGKNVWGGGLAPLNFPSSPLFPTPFPSPPHPLNFPSHPCPPFPSLPFPPPSLFFLIPSFPSLSPFPSPPSPPLRSRPP